MKRIHMTLLLGYASLLLACGGEETSSNYGKYTRAELRYYAYAPPLIPHEVINAKCLDCHKDGLVVQGFQAPVTPHPELMNCQQCHIRADERIKEFKQNSFVGIGEPRKLPLPQPAGPSLIPHRVFMRENCLVCHSDASRKEIIQTTHPERLNCVQCHVEQDTQAGEFERNLEVVGFSNL
jgi:cytochrome c-type protein NapB